MHIEPKRPTGSGPAEWFTGQVWMDVIAPKQDEPSRAQLNRVRFAPGARTAWHSHSVGQTLHITEGVALIGTRDGTVLELRPGETVWTPPGEEHWHGATREDFMEHLALWEVTADGDSAAWLEHVADEDYDRRG